MISSPVIEQVRLAYERDLRRPAGRCARGELPLSYEDITDDWLTNLLCRGAPGAEVVSHRLSPPDSGSSNRRKIYLRYNEAGRTAGLPQALFCKATQGLANRIILGISGGASIEADFYNHIRSRLNIEAPVTYYAHYDAESYNSIIMLGDLSDSVTEFCNQHTKMTRRRAESQVRLLASFHAHFLDRRECETYLSSMPTWREYFGRSMLFGLQEGSTQGFLDGKDVIPPLLYRRHAEIWDATMASVTLHDRLPQTLSHGDVHLKNWYVAGNGEMGLTDWQCASRGHWSRDLAYAISTALAVEDRRAWERELIELYLDSLYAAGGPQVAFAEAWDLYRQQLLSALTWWTITLHPAPGMPDMQPRDITLEFVRRICVAMDDLDSLGVKF